MEGFTPEGMSAQAQQIWSMLDDMAENDPAAYRKFIERQMKEGKEYMAPPDPHMCVQVMLLSKPPKPLFINFLEWQRVPEPKSAEDPVPVSGCPITQEKDEKGAFSLTAVAFNPKVLEKFGKNCCNPIDADTLVHLALDYVEHEQKVKVSRTYTILPSDTPVKGDLELVRLCFTKAFQRNSKAKGGIVGTSKPLDKDVAELEKTFGPLSSSERESLLSQLSNISASPASSGGGSGLSNGSHTHSPSGLMSDIGSYPHIRMPGASNAKSQPSANHGSNGSSHKANDGGLIQEISDHRLSSAPPKYTLETCRSSEGRQLVLKVELPGVKSVTECELDISEDDVKLVVPGKHDWKLKLPSAIDKDEAIARFSKKSCQLTLTMPVQT
ncbi:pih1 domain-containing protein 2 [Plakobranchus ocellatus]|uniref:Pih1 domain-containing protein 2 n=1 Tax=Plakobranchus ocellatus TaxID=259542 RepID=A0AAV4C3F3_9GAST|nr:pih1 domain-containing protein 2 [Plakobranchus ocellatus]